MHAHGSWETEHTENKQWQCHYRIRSSLSRQSEKLRCTSWMFRTQPIKYHSCNKFRVILHSILGLMVPYTNIKCCRDDDCLSTATAQEYKQRPPTNNELTSHCTLQTQTHTHRTIPIICCAMATRSTAILVDPNVQFSMFAMQTMEFNCFRIDS